MTRDCRRLVGEERGQILVWFALMLVVLVGFAGLVIDGAYYFKQRQELQAIADGAALAGAMQLNYGMLGGPTNSFKIEWFPPMKRAKDAALEYCRLYGIDDPELEMPVEALGEVLTVRLSREIHTFFIHVLTLERKMTVSVEAHGLIVDGY
jgi:hypothetical protein